MIDALYLKQWRQTAPWPSPSQIEQDLIISRALVALYNNPVIKNNLAFRGGTALNKLFLNPATRYSEDLDFVQCKIEPIGETLGAIREVLDIWLGSPEWKRTKRGHKLIYHYQSVEIETARLKIEINTTENYHFFDYLDIPFKVKSDWFEGETSIKAYQLNELMGSKLRALYQRSKGRDLFDLWITLQRLKINPDIIIRVFLDSIKTDNTKITRALFEKNLYEKAKDGNFTSEVNALIRPDINWDFNDAYKIVLKEFISQLPGE